MGIVLAEDYPVVLGICKEGMGCAQRVASGLGGGCSIIVGMRSLASLVGGVGFVGLSRCAMDTVVVSDPSFGGGHFREKRGDGTDDTAITTNHSREQVRTYDDCW